MQKVGSGRVTDIDLENKRNNPYYEVEVKDNRGVEHEIKINAQTGAIISYKIDR